MFCDEGHDWHRLIWEDLDGTERVVNSLSELPCDGVAPLSPSLCMCAVEGLPGNNELIAIECTEKGAELCTEPARTSQPKAAGSPLPQALSAQQRIERSVNKSRLVGTDLFQTRAACSELFPN